MSYLEKLQRYEQSYLVEKFQTLKTLWQPPVQGMGLQTLIKIWKKKIAENFFKKSRKTSYFENQKVLRMHI